jgi:hypothetical protein
MEECKKKYQAVEKRKVLPRINLNLKLLTDTHEKLVNGCPVEPQTVNIRLLSGIQNILSQNEEFDDAFAELGQLSPNVCKLNKFKKLPTQFKYVHTKSIV